MGFTKNWFKKCFYTLLLIFSSNSLASNDIDIEVLPYGDPCDAYLKITLINKFDRVIKIDNKKLPWIQGTRSIKMIMYDWNIDSAYSPTYLMSNPTGVGSFVQLRPGEALAGSLRLRDWFPEYGKSIRKKNLALYWTYIYLDNDSEAKLIKVGGVYLKKCNTIF